MRIVFLYAFLVFACCFTKAQPNIVFPTIEVKENDQFSVDLSVVNFSNIVGVQFSLQWDPSVIQFISAGGVNLPDASEPFGQTYVDSGTLTFLWITADISTGITLDSGQVIFSVNFQAVGNDGDSTQIAITNTPTPILVLNNTGVNVGLTYEGGIIRIDNSVSTRNALSNKTLDLVAFPTNTRNILNIQVDIPDFMNSSIAIYSIGGVKVFTSHWLLHPGLNSTSVNVGNFLSNGIYFLVLDTDSGFRTTRFIVNK
jgi:hypothetical protein